MSTHPRARLQSWLEQIWYHGRPVPAVLAMLERVWDRVYRNPVRPMDCPPCPVIVVGNLVVGGAGKTPLVIELTRRLRSAGWAVAVISRGHGRRGRGLRRVCDADDAREVGDEPLEIVRATGAPVWVAARRARALQAAVEAGAQIVISDDGLQHVALPRSFEICVIDGELGFGNGRLLPAGPLRQRVDRLDQVDLVVYRNQAPPDSSALAYTVRTASPCPVDPGTPPLAPGVPIDAVAGIARPERFFTALENMGHPLRRHPLGDHAAIDPAWLAALEGPVVLTAKDLVRLGSPVPRPDLYVAPVEVELPDGLVQAVLGHVREFRQA
ncbi:MAG: tetraacyldisaccharide 4'-kinase [Wenzhouxiangellaceae bacterium]